MLVAVGFACLIALVIAISLEFYVGAYLSWFSESWNRLLCARVFESIINLTSMLKLITLWFSRACYRLLGVTEHQGA